jgi:hypothetical protein
MAIQALLIPALTSFAISKLTGSSTKSALRNALLAGATAGITEGFSAANAAKQAGDISTIGMSDIAKGAVSGKGTVSTGIKSLKDLGAKDAFSLFGKDFTYGDVAKAGIPTALLYRSYAKAANAPKETMFYGANINYADPRIFSQVGPQSFKVGEYDSQGQMTAQAIPGSADYVPPEEYYRSGAVPTVPYAMGKQLITAKEGGLATLKGIKKYNEGGQVLPSKMTHDENDANNYVRANGHVVDISSMADKDEDTVLAQLADGEFVTRADGVLGAGILAGANPDNMKEMRKKGAKYFYDQQAKFKRIFDLLNANRASQLS